MKQKLRLFTSLLLLAVASVAWGETVTLKYSGSTTTNMSGENEAATLGLSETEWSVVGGQGSASNMPGLNKAGDIRLYYHADGGNTLTVTSLTGATINSINITFTDSNYSNASILVDGSPVTGTDGTYEINSSAFVVTNGNTSNVQVRISQIEITYTPSSTPATTYTVSFDAGDGTFVGNDDFPNASNSKVAGTYTLPSATPAAGYVFDGWLASGITTPVKGSYTVSGDVAFTAQYSQSSSGDANTATLTQSNLGLTGSYATAEKTIDGITYVFTDLMKNNESIQAKASTGTIKNTTAYPGDITSVVITHDGTARAATINGSADGENWTQVATGSGSITADFSGKGYKYFQITRGSNAAYWTKIEITYSTSSSSQEQSDLAITNASTDLVFDLFNNAEAQVIYYSTSSTGAITITPAESEYFTITHDAVNKEITVNPTAVTPSPQTVTISQAADDSYYAGTTSFKVFISDSTPFSGSQFIFNTDEGLSELDITKPESGKGTDLDADAGYTKGNVTMNVSHGATNNTRVWNSNGNTDLRVYNGGTLTFTVPAGYAITKVTFEGSDIHFVGLTDNVWTASGNPVNTVTFTNGSTGSKINTIKVEYEEDNTPMLSAKDVDLAYDATSGSIEYTLTNEVAGGVVSAESSESWLSVGTPNDGIVDLTCSANSETTTRTATVTLSYSYGNNASVTKEVIVTQAAAPLIYTTIPALFEAATSTETDVNVTFNNWVVSGVSNNGKNIFVTDNNGNGFIIYYSSDMSDTFSAGNILSGTVACKLKKFNGSAELLNLNADKLTIVNGGTVSVSNISMADLAGVNTGAVVSYEGLTCFVDDGKYYLTDGTSTLQVYNSLYAFEALEDGAKYNITGVYQQYNNTKEILPRSAADIVELIAVTISENAKGKNDVGTEVYFGTLYYSNKHLKMSGSNLGAHPIKVVDGKITELATYSSNRGDVIPAGTAVLLEAREPGTYTFEVVKEAPSYTAPSDNMLRGTDEQTTITEPGYKYYMLSRNANSDAGSLGFYWGKDSKEGTQITNGAHKAYLAVPAGVAGNAKGFTFSGETDGIRQIENGELTIENAEIYNLSGQRVNKAQKGVYIVNGKKVVIR